MAIPIPSRCFIPNENLPAFSFQYLKDQLFQVSENFESEYHITNALFIIKKAESTDKLQGAD